MQADKLQRTADHHDIVTELVTRARAAMAAFRNDDQAAVDDAVTALAWSIYQPERARVLALLIEEVRFDAAEEEVEITFRPGGPRALRNGNHGGAR